MKMKNKFLLLILGLSTHLMLLPSSFASETTYPYFEDMIYKRTANYSDGTCSGLRPNQCCYQGWKYSNCNFLYDQLEGGYCLHKENSTQWKQCSIGVKKSASPKVYKVAAVSTKSFAPQYSKLETNIHTGSLYYAADLTACASYGKRQAGGANMCAKGVRHALACMARRRGHKVNNEFFKCGVGANDYYGKNCLEKKGFVNVIRSNPKACNTPGVIRVYYGNHHRQRAYRNRGGDYYGHIEFLGTNGMWNAGASSSKPINERFGNNRRRLKACYVLPKGVI